MSPSCCAPIDVMQSAEDVLRNDLPAGTSRPEHFRIARRALPKRSMRRPLIKVTDIRCHYSTQTGLVEDETLGAHRFRPTLRNRIRSRRPKRGPDLLNAKAPQAALECRAIAAIAIVNEKSWWPSTPSAALDYLLRRPLRGRTWRHRHVQNSSVEAPDHKKDIQPLEPDASNAEEVTDGVMGPAAGREAKAAVSR
jgi:hypothetical protein